MSYTRKQPGTFHREMRFDRMALGMLRAYFFGTGPGTVVPGGLHAFIKTRPELSVPDIEFMFRGTSTDAHLWFPLVQPPFLDGFGIRPTLLHPGSRGEILLGSADPMKPPRIVYRFFTAPNDLPTLREGAQACAQGRARPGDGPLSRRGDQPRPAKCRLTTRSMPG